MATTLSNDNDSAVAFTQASSSQDLYLSSEERFEVWQIKSAERPELLDKFNDGDDDDEQDTVPPLTDGCDLEGWRRAGMVTCSFEQRAVLNVGLGCTLLRRESQLPMLSQSAFQKWHALRNALLQAPENTAERLDYNKNLTLHSWFERDNVPVIIDGCCTDWKAMESCRFDQLVERFGDTPWRFSDTHGETMSLYTYAKYINSMEGQMDDAPLAVYDSQFGTDERAAILDEYHVPSCFDTDLFALVDEEHRPPYRWILIGPARSGTGLHVDPVGTHAWVTLIQGCKRWILFPYVTSPSSIHMQDPQIPSALWFRDYYHLRNLPGAIEILQRPGETVYVPAGWPHLVLNLELSVAITHNYATEYPCMQRLWDTVIQAEPELAVRFYQALQKDRPDLAEQLTTSSSRTADFFDAPVRPDDTSCSVEQSKVVA